MLLRTNHNDAHCRTEATPGDTTLNVGRSLRGLADSRGAIPRKQQAKFMVWKPAE